MATTSGLVQQVSARQERAIVALLNNPTVSAAAKESGVAERTLHTWLRQAPFLAAYRFARRESFSQAIALTHRYAGHAVQTLAKIMTDAAAPYTARVQAAVAILRFGREGIELEDLAARVDALEEAAGLVPGPGRARGAPSGELGEIVTRAASIARERGGLDA